MDNITKYQLIKGLRKGDKVPYKKMVYDMSLGLGLAPPREIREALEEALERGLVVRVGRDQIQFRGEPPKPPTKKRVEKKKHVMISKKVEDHILSLTDNKRFERGRAIPEEEISNFVIEENGAKAMIRGYPTIFDIVNRRIEHKGCIDWQRQKKSGRICKHVVKLFMELVKHGKEGWVLRVDKTWDYT